MDSETMTIEQERMVQLEQDRIADEMAAEEELEEGAKAKPAEEHYISPGEAILLLAFTGLVALISWAFDFIPFLGWIINLIINLLVGLTLFIWVSGKVAKGASVKWYKAIYYGAAGSFFGGYLGAIIYLLIQDRKILGKVAGKLGESVEKVAQKI